MSFDYQTPSWMPVDLSAVIAGVQSGAIVGPVPTLMSRTDGPCLLYPGEVHSLAGEPESGKGWITLATARAIIADGCRALPRLRGRARQHRHPAPGARRRPRRDPRAVRLRAPVRPVHGASAPRRCSTLALRARGHRRTQRGLRAARPGPTPTPTPPSSWQRSRARSPTAALRSSRSTTSPRRKRPAAATPSAHSTSSPAIAAAYSTDVIKTPSRTAAGHGQAQGREGPPRPRAQPRAGRRYRRSRTSRPTDAGDRVTVVLEPPDAAIDQAAPSGRRN